MLNAIYIIPIIMPFDLKIHRLIRLGETPKSITPAGPQTHTDVEVAYMQLHVWQTKADFEHWNPRTSRHKLFQTNPKKDVTPHMGINL